MPSRHSIRFFAPGSLFYFKGKFYKHHFNPAILDDHTDACSFCGVYNCLWIKECPLMFHPKIFNNNRCRRSGYFIQYFPEKFSIEKLIYTIYYHVSTANFFRRHPFLRSCLTTCIYKLTTIYRKVTRRAFHAQQIF